MSRTKTIRIVKEITFDVDKLKSAYHDIFYDDIAAALREENPEYLKQLASDLQRQWLAEKAVASISTKIEVLADPTPSGPGD